ncbi:bacterioferritin-associated ferredoxin [Rhodococcus sp. NPDC059234]|uniref:(2Fe-2S)-binding protein n=1 Tax=Rhodococcus sp. NPDC059234 TaxID=3346781 RepID=UPI00366F6859
MYACICAGTSEEQVQLCIAAGAHTSKQVAMGCGAGKGRNCGLCRDRIKSMIEDHLSNCEVEQVEQISA